MKSKKIIAGLTAFSIASSVSAGTFTVKTDTVCAYLSANAKTITKEATDFDFPDVTIEPSVSVYPVPVVTSIPSAYPVPVPTTAPSETSSPVPVPTTAPSETSSPVPVPTTAPSETSSPVPVPTTAPSETSYPVPVPTTAPSETSYPVPVPTTAPSETSYPSPVITTAPESSSYPSPAVTTVSSVTAPVIVSPLPETSSATDAVSGVCGDNLTWKLDDNGTLTVSGTGNIYDFSSSDLKSPFRYNMNIKKVILENGVTGMGNRTFEGCSELTSVILPDGLKTIEDFAFFGCINLSDIKIPESVNRIGAYAFHSTAWHAERTRSDDKEIKFVIVNDILIDIKCYFDTTVIIPSGVRKIDSIGECNAKSIVIPDSVTRIEDNAFMNNMSLESVVIPDSVKSIGDQAFYNCTSLKSVSVPDSVESFGDRVFMKCENLEKASLSVNAGTTGDAAFFWCGKLKSVNIPEGINKIGNEAFCSCSSLETITIPESVSSIGGHAFSGTKWLENRQNESDDHLVTVNDILIDFSKAEGDVTVPDGIKAVSGLAGEDAVSYSSSRITSVSLPQSVTDIGNWAFAYCKDLSSVIIPDNIERIGERAFYGCSGLKSITVKNPDCEFYDYNDGSYYIAFYVKNNFSGKVFGYKNSTAEEFADRNNCVFEALDEVPEILQGDVTGDGKITVADAIILSRYIAGGWNVSISEKASDVNKDGKITIADAILIRRYLAGGWNISL